MIAVVTRTSDESSAKVRVTGALYRTFMFVQYGGETALSTAAAFTKGRGIGYLLSMPAHVTRKPEWLKIQLNTNDNFRYLKHLMREERLNTVCEEARCPNIHECWGEHRTATFMILGDTCTRRCRFCAVKTGLPSAVDLGEPMRVADSVARMELKHVVITMVNRDDLKDGGAEVLANTVRAIHRAAEGCSVEVLTSDFMGNRDAVAVVMARSLRAVAPVWNFIRHGWSSCTI